MTQNAAPIDIAGLFRLDGRVAVVTGASSGLGSRFARVLSAAGARVVVAARRSERLADLAREIPECLVLQTDVAKKGDRERLISETVSHFGRIDVLVNNAGVGMTKAIEDETLDDFQNILDINTVALWHLSKLAGEHMVAQSKGSIINIASMLGHVGGAPMKQSSYATSKGAVVNMSRELGAQWGRKGVRVNALCPGFFPSEMTSMMDGDEQIMDFVRRNSPIPRLGYENELDGALLFLASDASTFMTGQSLIVDGGWTAR